MVPAMKPGTFPIILMFAPDGAIYARWHGSRAQFRELLEGGNGTSICQTKGDITLEIALYDDWKEAQSAANAFTAAVEAKIAEIEDLAQAAPGGTA